MQDRTEEAEEAYRKAIELDPKHAQAYYTLGVVLGMQDRTEEAEEAYRKAIELDPNHAKAYYNLGVMLGEQENLAEAIQCFKKTHEILPRTLSALTLANVFKKVNNPILSNQYVVEARSMISAEDWYSLACVESIDGHPDLAFEYLERASQALDFNREWAWKDPDFEWIRDDKRFSEIVGSIQ
jgi:tetratricopeptide (TPR) repeat protein